MKSFIERVFKKRKENAEQVKEQIVEQPIEQVKQVKEEATRAAVEAIIEEVKEVIKQEEVVYSKPGHYFPDCNCFKCVRWRNQNAK